LFNKDLQGVYLKFSIRIFITEGDFSPKISELYAVPKLQYGSAKPSNFAAEHVQILYRTNGTGRRWEL
jgi:hypothetical protein